MGQHEAEHAGRYPCKYELSLHAPNTNESIKQTRSRLVGQLQHSQGFL